MTGHAYERRMAKKRIKEAWSKDISDEPDPISARCVAFLCCLPCVLVDGAGRLCRYDVWCPEMAARLGATARA